MNELNEKGIIMATMNCKEIQSTPDDALPLYNYFASSDN